LWCELSNDEATLRTEGQFKPDCYQRGSVVSSAGDHTIRFCRGLSRKLDICKSSLLASSPSLHANRVLYRKNLQPGTGSLWLPKRQLGLMLFFSLDVPRGLVMQLWSAALNGRTSTKDRIRRGRMFPCAIHTTNSHSQSIACWQLLNRESRPHLLRSALQRLRSGSCLHR
jgi:hypothetical protein